MENFKTKRKQSREGNANSLFKQRIEGDHNRLNPNAPKDSMKMDELYMSVEITVKE
jgi:hypothetical protein